MDRKQDKGSYSSPEAQKINLDLEGPVCYSDLSDNMVNEEMDVIDYSML